MRILLELVTLASVLAGCAVDAASPPAEAVAVAPLPGPAAMDDEVDEVPLAHPRRTLGSLRVESDDVLGEVERVRREVLRRKGQIMQQQIATEGKGAYSAGLQLRLPEAEVDAFVRWLEGHGSLALRKLEVEEGLGALVDVRREIAAREASQRRLDDLLGRLGGRERLEAERELGRVRRELARLRKAEHDFIAADGRAVLELTVLRPHEVGPEARLRVGLRATRLDLGDPAEESARRRGLGLSFGTLGSHEFSFDLDVLEADPSRQDDRRALLTTLGGSVYSEYLGGGRRQWLNPLLGFRIGYGSAAGHGAVALGIELGLELYKRGPFSLTVFGRTLALLRGDGASSGTHAGAALLLPF